MSAPIRVSILGATGYGGGELLRLLLRAPEFRIAFATSRAKGGTPVGGVHRNLDGLTELCFSDPSREEIAEKSDVIIGALPHGASAETLSWFIDAGKRVIDLSGDFRLRDAESYKRWYEHDHPRPDLLARSVYGCTELNAERIAGAQLVAAPGCFATAINLALLPAASAGLLRGIPVVTGLTGSSGAGAEHTATTHHPTRAQTIRPYKVLKHQHTPEILQLAGDAGSALGGLSFIPISAPIVRGILVSVSAELGGAMSQKETAALYRDFYAKRGPFVKVLGDREPECGSIAGTNYAEVRARVGEDGRLHVVATIDNLLKGGAGQGVESLYLMHGLDPAAATSPLSWPGMWP